MAQRRKMQAFVGLHPQALEDTGFGAIRCTPKKSGFQEPPLTTFSGVDA
ncbi:MAG: hypothetical protein ABI919_03540 [Ramlibacter sp.]